MRKLAMALVIGLALSITGGTAFGQAQSGTKLNWKPAPVSTEMTSEGIPVDAPDSFRIEINGQNVATVPYTGQEPHMWLLPTDYSPGYYVVTVSAVNNAGESDGAASVIWLVPKPTTVDRQPPKTPEQLVAN